MSKRNAPAMNEVGDANGHRPKRRKDALAEPSQQQDASISDDGDDAGGEIEGGIGGGEGEVVGKMDLNAVKETGLKWWEVLKDSTTKDGRTVSVDFMRQPSRRQYPDYYEQIKQPIALEDIKEKLESNGYTDIRAVKQDFDLCFKNARAYNLKNSVIWKDARSLQRTINNHWKALVSRTEVDADAEEGAEPGKKKQKAPSITRSLKARLQKLVEKTDEDGRILSIEFMELPSKKDWPSYYTAIKRPMALEYIFKKVKRKEYPTSQDFADEVELVFQNALEYNQEGSTIWKDALTLRDFFRKIMGDLPEPFTLPQYARQNAKIKLKVPGSSSIAVPKTETETLQAPLPPPTANGGPVPQPPGAIPASQPSTSFVAPSTPAVAPTAQPYTPSTFVHPYTPSYQQPHNNFSTASPSITTVNLKPTIATPVAASISPAPLSAATYELKSISLYTEPRGRVFTLDHREGVKTWVLQLASNESVLYIRNMRFQDDEDDDDDGSNSGEEDTVLEKDKEEVKDEEDDAMLVDEDEEALPETPSKNGTSAKRRGKGRRGRPPKGAKAKGKAIMQTTEQKTVPKKTKPKMHIEAQVKLDGVVAAEKDESKGEWSLIIPVGSHTLQVGGKDGAVWKVYANRSAST